jgi:hypothetical protein
MDLNTGAPEGSGDRRVRVIATNHGRNVDPLAGPRMAARQGLDHALQPAEFSWRRDVQNRESIR